MIMFPTGFPHNIANAFEIHLKSYLNKIVNGVGYVGHGRMHHIEQQKNCRIK